MTQKHSGSILKSWLSLSNRPTESFVLDRIEQICVSDAKGLLENGFRSHALMSMVLGMEWLGAIMDRKPTGAKSLSRKRFVAVLGLFPQEYLEIHKDIDLYRQLRNRTVHNPWVKSKFLSLGCDSDSHLTKTDGMWCINLENLCNDLGSVLGKVRQQKGL